MKKLLAVAAMAAVLCPTMPAMCGTAFAEKGG